MGGGTGEAFTLLSTTYFGPVQWYQKLHRYDHVMVERMDSFVKQTYRNRCVIAAPNGPQALTIPVSHDCDKPLTRDIRISDHGNWRRLHWNALQTAYGESPFFEHYADDLRPFFERRWEYLYDFNMEITLLMCQLLDIHPVIAPTDSYLPSGSPESSENNGDSDHSCLLADFRDTIHPKHPLPDPDFSPKPYYQVYADRHGFLPNLSILDLLFNEGNESIFFL
ncbi:MAG: WbqC family protein [Prevotella sp.]|nr:WbqC family protein [Prevotella sp.]